MQDSEEELNSIREWAAKLAATLIEPKANHYNTHKLDTEILKALHSDGLMTLNVPESEGGAALTPRAFAITIEEISKASGSVGVTVSVTNMIADVLMREGNAHHREKFLKQLVDGR